MNRSNPYAPPKASLRDIYEGREDIDELQVSEKWKTRFHLIDKAGGPAMPDIKSLDVSERRKIGFNFLGFLFGPLYYLAKGMWRKAIVFFVLGVIAIIALSMILTAIGLEKFDRAVGYGLAAVFAVRANIDYYKRMVLGDNGWW